MLFLISLYLFIFLSVYMDIFFVFLNMWMLEQLERKNTTHFFISVMLKTMVESIILRTPGPGTMQIISQYSNDLAVV